MRLTGETSHAPTGDDTVDSATLGDTDDVDHLVLGEDIGHADLLLKQVLAEVDLGINVSSVDLDLLEVCLLLADLSLLDLRVDQQADNLAVLLRASDLRIHLV